MANTYKYGFQSSIRSTLLEIGLDETIIHKISDLRNEPKWLLNFRLRAYKHWLTLNEPHWSSINYKPIDYQQIAYYASVLPHVLPIREQNKMQKIFQKLGIPLQEQDILNGVAVDAVLDSVSVKTTYKTQLLKLGIIFLSFNEAVQQFPDIVQKYLSRVIPISDNFFACLNSAVFSDGTFVYIPKNVHCPIELSSYFRLNEAKAGQFERTLIICEEGSYVSYLEGCSAPRQSNHQLHAAVVELIALDRAEIKYSTIQNWYPGNSKGQGGIFNFVTKRGLCAGFDSKISWTQIETGAHATWKYPSCILQGDNSIGEFYSIACTTGRQQADTGTKMIHIGQNTSSKIVSKTISSGKSVNTYRGMVKVTSKASNTHNYSVCDSLVLTKGCSVNTYPLITSTRQDSSIEHEASTTKINEAQLNYLLQRGMSNEEAVSLIITGFSKEILQKLPLEFAIEAQKLLEISFEGSVG